ncbi:MAG: B12-binding domain-containing radical SAM protein [Candidatus Omnitrophota bacterium]|nr:MAG: B12-binding domain-containing radical SAM protein [Candidatus Omnitrophota bacterium]
MKITFLYVNPNRYTGIPVGLSYLISILKNEGHELSLFDTTFYDFNYTDFNLSGNLPQAGKEIINGFKLLVKKKNPDLVGVSCTSVCLNFAIKMLESLENRPITIFGGVGATVDYTELIKKEVVDYVCVGFGEKTLPIFVKNLENKKSVEGIQNLVYKKEKQVKINEFSQIVDLSKIPIPDWSLFDKRHFKRIFKGRIKRWGSFQLVRGCPFNCAYCVNNYYHKTLGIKINRLPIEKSIEEIKVLSQKYRLDIIRLCDECFGFGNPEYYRKFARAYKREVGPPTIVATRPEAITPETIEILKDLKCISVSIGIEAGDEAQRKWMLDRRVSNEIIKRAFDLLYKAGIRTSSYNIIGFPEDTRKKIFETIKLNRECKPGHINVFIFSPLPKTKLRDYCLKNGLLDTTSAVDFIKKSIVKNKNLTKQELYGLFRTFEYYIKLPEYVYPLIKRAEKGDKIGNIIFNLLKKVAILRYGY